LVQRVAGRLVLGWLFRHRSPRPLAVPTGLAGPSPPQQ
jgi:hypothetical protein